MKSASKASTLSTSTYFTPMTIYFENSQDIRDTLPPRLDPRSPVKARDQNVLPWEHSHEMKFQIPDFTTSEKMIFSFL